MRRQAGFNLIELMVVVFIAAIMLGIGVPAFRDFVAGQRVKTAAFDFASALLLARSEAIKRNAPVTIDQASGGWQNGWTVNAAGAALARQDPASNVTIAPTPAVTDKVTFQGNGRIAGTLQFQFGGANTTSVRCVTVTVSGVPNTKTTSCS